MQIYAWCVDICVSMPTNLIQGKELWKGETQYGIVGMKTIFDSKKKLIAGTCDVLVVGICVCIKCFSL